MTVRVDVSCSSVFLCLSLSIYFKNNLFVIIPTSSERSTPVLTETTTIKLNYCRDWVLGLFISFSPIIRKKFYSIEWISFHRRSSRVEIHVQTRRGEVNARSGGIIFMLLAEIGFSRRRKIAKLNRAAADAQKSCN